MKAALGDLPAPIKMALVAVVLLVVVGGLVAAFVFGGWVVGLVLLGGLFLVFLVLIVFLALAAAAKKSKAKPFEQELAQNSASSSGVSDAAARARVDDLSKRFLEGINTFKRYGKDIYDLPWFMIVGEPGSGKTEVIRHSGIGFPPGLQNELQGSGGTRNMDWWFSNNAIILDTAGRLLFEEASSKNNDEWRALLKMLGKHRATCPVNGLMLVIPADSLIKDSGDEIEAKAGRIKAQLDLIQTTLDVRFPVFILITKADLINGFREFFDELDDPQLQHQIMGWSNPEPLDAPFDPNQVFDHMLTIQDRLVRRRGGLMLDPVAREEERRIDEIDAMFAFPDAIEQIGGRLERYMQVLFSSSEWATKPLFMRGIYFVSSMQEGSALDADLAEAMGISVDDLPEGRVWARDRAYFIRDLFTKKMFKERGLVTRSSDTKKLKRRRKAVMGVFTSILLLVFLGVTAFSWLTLQQTMRRPSAFWGSVRSLYSGGTPPVAVRGTGPTSDSFGPEGGTFTARNPVQLENSDDLDMFTFMQKVQTQSEVELNVPTAFLPAAWLTLDSGNVEAGNRREAARLVFARSTLVPTLRAAHARVGSVNTVSPDPALLDPRVLAELVRVHRLNDNPVWASSPGTPDLAPVMLFAAPKQGLSDTQREEAAAALQGVFVKLLEHKKGWVEGAEARANPDAAQTLDRGVRAYASLVAEGRVGVSGEGGAQSADPMEVLRAARLYLEAEEALIAAYEGGGGSLVAWPERYEAVKARGDELRELTSGIEGDLVAWLNSGVAGREQALRGAVGPLMEAVTVAPLAEQSLIETEAPEPYKTWQTQLQQSLDQAAVSFESARTLLSNRRTALEGLFARVDGQPGFAARLARYSAADRLVTDSWVASSFSELPPSLKNLEDRFDQEIAGNRVIAGNPSSADALKRAAAASRRVLELARPQKRSDLFSQDTVARGMPATFEEVKAEVTEHAEQYDGGLGIEPEWVSGLGLVEVRRNVDFPDPGYHPAAARRVLDAISGVDKAGNAVRGAERARDQYAQNFAEYWGGLLREGGVSPVRYGVLDWQGTLDLINGMRARETTERLKSLLDARIGAIEGVLDSEEITLEADVRRRLEQARDKLAGQRTRLTSGKFEDQFGDWQESWGRLSTDPNAARRELLRIDQGDFDEYYAQFCDGVDEFDYLHELTVAMVESLAIAYAGEAGQALLRVNEQAEKFPLAAWPAGVSLSAAPPAGVLTQAQLEAFQDDVRKAQPAGAGGGDFPPGSLGGRDYRNVKELTDPLKRLRGEANADEQARLDHLRRLAEALGEVRSARFAMLPQRKESDPSANRINASGFYDFYFVVGGDEEFTEISSTSTQRYELSTVREPQGSFALRFLDSEGRSIQEQVSGPWGPLAFVHKFGGTSADGGRTWEVEYTTNQNGRTLVQWFEVQFNVPLGVDRIEKWSGDR